ncbi:MAG: prolipoprotein diacylglyceryl transferase [Hyphomicrobiaceae bacterium]
MTLLTLPFPDINPVAIWLGPVPVRWYGLAYASGLLLGWWYIKRLVATDRLWSRGKSPIPPETIDDLLLFVTIGVIVGGRLGHVLFYEPASYFANPLDILKVWQGGMSFHGGVAGVFIMLWLFARWKRMSMLSVGDVVTAAVPIGLFFGRIANFINSEVVGSVTTVPWAIVFPGWGAAPRHPAMLYEAALEGIVLFACLAWLIYRRYSLRMPGLTGGAFLLGYGVLRIFAELFKIDEYRLIFPELPITRGMFYSVPMLLLGAFFIWQALRNARRDGAHGTSSPTTSV